jgi:hypothetical protein
VNPETRKPKLRCAIYTRVSTEPGLEQEFNSLDNQREASEACVKSQAHEGGGLIRDRYDDGGYSGGSMERPALKRLLDDVRARRLDVIVVYEVDRLTRSLFDFGWLDELLTDPTTSVGSLALRVGRSERSLRMTLLLAFLAPDLMKASTEGRLPRGFGIKRLIDLPMLWSEQWRILGLQAPSRPHVHVG